MGPGRRVNQTQGVDAIDVTSLIAAGKPNVLGLQGYHSPSLGLGDDGPRMSNGFDIHDFGPFPRSSQRHPPPTPLTPQNTHDPHLTPMVCRCFAVVGSWWVLPALRSTHVVLRQLALVLTGPGGAASLTVPTDASWQVLAADAVFNPNGGTGVQGLRYHFGSS